MARDSTTMTEDSLLRVYATMTIRESIKRSLRIGESLAKFSIHRYKALSLLGKCFIWVLVAIYIAIGTAFIVITPAVIFQWLYDLSHRISEMDNGWLILAAIVGM